VNTLKPKFFNQNIKGALKNRNLQAMAKTKKFVEMSQEMVDLISNAESLSKSKDP
jgi:hypothetical protein